MSFHVGVGRRVVTSSPNQRGRFNRVNEKLLVRGIPIFANQPGTDSDDPGGSESTEPKIFFDAEEIFVSSDATVAMNSRRLPFQVVVVRTGKFPAGSLAVRRDGTLIGNSDGFDETPGEVESS